MEITLQQIQKITGITDNNKLTALLKGITDIISKYSINTPLRLSHFLAQVMHESEDFTAVKENLNYSAQALVATWPSHFTAAQAADCARNQVKIGNRAYGGRMGNGDIASGDGYKFLGRGYLQITGKSNYNVIGKSLGLDLIDHPELLEQPEYAMLSAGWFWNDRELNKVADVSAKDVTKVTKVVNGGVNGLASRQANFNKIFPILS